MEDRLREQTWLHAQIARVARRLVGVDISESGVRRARELGYEDSYAGDVEELSAVPFPRLNYDLILVPDVIEHLANPGRFLAELRAILTDGADFILTTPSALSIRTLFYPLIRTEVVHPDHNFYYSPTTLATLLRKNGLATREIWLYSSVWAPNLRDECSLKRRLVKIVYVPVDIALRYLIVPIFPYFSDGMLLHVKKGVEG